MAAVNAAAVLGTDSIPSANASDAGLGLSLEETLAWEPYIRAKDVTMVQAGDK